jgi:hypothetical protein
MSQRSWILLGVLAVLIAVWRLWPARTQEIPPPPVPSEQTESTDLQKSSTVTASENETATTTSPENNGAEKSAPLGDEQIRVAFSAAVKDIGPCLALQNPVGEGVEPTLEGITSTLRAEMGDIVLQTEDWSVVNLQTPDGEQRRIRVEMDYSGEDRVVRRVKYQRIVAGDIVEIPLSSEQAEDPNDTFMASLESDGQVQSREKAQRAYFAGGEEVVAQEKDGRLTSVDVSRNGKTFRCNLTEGTPFCRCL